MKKSMAILCVFIMMFSFGTIVHAEENSIEVTSNLKEYNVGDTVKVTVKAVDAKDLYSADLTINYDPEYLELVASKFNVLQELDSKIQSGTNRYLLSILGKNEGVNGNVNIAEFEFKAIRKGSTKIAIPSTVFVNSKEEKKENIKAAPLQVNIIEKSNIVNVQEVKLNTSSYKLKIGESYKLIETVLPENASNKKVRWESNKPDIVEVKDGQIRGLKEGSAIITVTTEDGSKKAECLVEVYKSTNNNGNDDELPQTGGIAHLPLIGLGMMVLGTIIKKKH